MLISNKVLPIISKISSRYSSLTYSGLDSTTISVTLPKSTNVFRISSRASFGSSYGFRKLPDAKSLTVILSSSAIGCLLRCELKISIILALSIGSRVQSET